MMLESSSENNDRMIICDACRREYRLQVNGDEDSYFLAKLLYRNSELDRLQSLLYPPDKLVIGDIIIHNDLIHTPPHLGAAFWKFVFKPKPIDYRRIGLGTNLLQFAIKKARKRRIKRICGSLTQEDINNNSHPIK